MFLKYPEKTQKNIGWTNLGGGSRVVNVFCGLTIFQYNLYYKIRKNKKNACFIDFDTANVTLDTNLIPYPIIN